MWALVRFISCMLPLVPPQRIVVASSVLAHITLKGLFASVLSHM